MNSSPLIIHLDFANLEASEPILHNYSWSLSNGINFPLECLKVRKPTSCSSVNFLLNLLTCDSRSLHLFSSYIIKLFFVKTLLTFVTIVVLSRIFGSTNSSMVLEFKILMIFCASKYAFVLCIVVLTLCTSSSCSKLI